MVDRNRRAHGNRARRTSITLAASARAAADRTLAGAEPLERRAMLTAAAAPDPTVTYVTARQYGVGASPADVTVGDFNADGSLDYAAALSGTGQVAIGFGNGHGGFATPVLYAVGGTPVSITAADLNGDGRPDLAVANAGDGTVSVLLGQAGGTFAPAPVGGSPHRDYAVGDSPNQVVAADVNGDGVPDLLTADSAGQGSSAPVLSVLLGVPTAAGSGVGTGTFAPAWTSAVTSQYWAYASSIAVADFNGDGVPDVALGNPDAGYVLIANGHAVGGHGDGTFAYAGRVTPSTGTPDYYGQQTDAADVVAADVTGDGRADLVVASGASGVAASVDVLAGNGDDTFGPDAVTFAGRGPARATLADLTGATVTLPGGGTEPRLDVVVADSGFSATSYADSEGGVAVLLNDGAGHLAPAAAYQADAGPAAVAVGDVNGDGTPDLLVADAASDDLSLDLGTGAGAFAAARQFAVQPLPAYAGVVPGELNPQGVAAADLTGDGKPDLVVDSSTGYGGGDASGTGYVSVLAANGDGTYRDPVKTAAGTAARGLAVAPFGGAAAGPGVAVADADGHVTVLSGFSAAGGGFATSASYAVSGTPVSVAAADLNGDGYPDLVVGLYNASAVAVLLNNGDGTFSAAQTFAGVGTGAYVAAGDLNGDGRPDVVQTCVYGGTDTVGVLVNRGTANGVWQGLAAPVAYDTGSGSPTTPAVVADLDGDGTADVAVGTSAGTVSVLTGVGDGTLRAAAVAATLPATGVTPSSLAAADVNGDGRIDLVIGTGTANAVYVLRNLGWSATAWQGFDPGTALAAGSTVSAVAVTDANGDGHPDVAAADFLGDAVGLLLQDPPLTASAGGPYSPVEGSTATLSATATYAGAGSLTYEWDLNYDGQTFRTTPGTFAASVPFDTAARLGTALAGSVAVRVTDLAGQSTIASAALYPTPAAPTGLSGTRGQTADGLPRADLAWNNASGIAVSTLVQRFDPTNGWTTVVTVPAGSPAFDQTLPAGTGTYTYRLVATVDGRDSAPSAPIDVVVAPPATPLADPGSPAPPSVLGVRIDADNSLRVNWSVPASHGGQGYDVYYATRPDGESTAPSRSTTTPNVPTGFYFPNSEWLDLTPLADGGYYVRVVDHATGASSAWTASATLLQPPAQPVGVAANASSSTQAYVTWTGGTGATAEGYEVAAEAHGQTSFTTVAAVGPDANANGSFGTLVGGLTPNTRYTFEVFAFDADGNGPAGRSSVDATTTDAPLQLSVAPEGSYQGRPLYAFLASGGDAGNDPGTHPGGVFDTWDVVTGTGGGATSPVVLPTGTGPGGNGASSPTGNATLLAFAGTGPYAATVTAHGPNGGTDTETYYSSAPTFVLTGTAAADAFAVSVSGNTYTVTGGVAPVTPFVSPDGVNLEVYGRGGADSLAVGPGATVHLLNNPGADGTVLTVDNQAGSTMTVVSGARIGGFNFVDGGDVTVVSRPPVGPTAQPVNFAGLHLPPPVAPGVPGGAFAPPSGTDTFDPPMATGSPVTTNPGEPLIANVTATGGPGDVLALSVSGLIAAGDAQKRAPTRFYVYGQTTASNGTLVEAPVVSADAAAGAVSIRLPGNLPAGSTYLVWAANAVGDGPTPTTTVYSPAVVVNAPTATWATVRPVSGDGDADDSDHGVSRYVLSVFGTNLDRDGEQAAADVAGGFGDASWVYVRPLDGNGDSINNILLGPIKTTPVAAAADGSGALDVNPYKVDLVLSAPGADASPNALPAGTASVDVYVANGHGGALGISAGVNVPNAVIGTVVPTQSVGPTYQLKDVLQDGDSEYLGGANGNTSDRINPAAITHAAQFLHDAHVAGGEKYAFVTLVLPPGTVDLTGSFVPQEGIHYRGAGSGLNSGYATIFQPAVGAGPFSNQALIFDHQVGEVSNTAFANVSIRANNPALTGAAILSTSLNPTSPGYLTTAVLFDNTADAVDFDNVTIDGRLDPSGVQTAQAVPGILIVKAAEHVSVANSTFYGVGVNYAYHPYDDSFDNCTFHASGASGNEPAAINAGPYAKYVSVTRCLVEAAVDDRSVQSGNSDYDSASRLFWAPQPPGYLYVGDNTSHELYPVPEVDGADLNGGEQVLVEPIQASGDYENGSATYVNGKNYQTPVGLASDLDVTAFAAGTFAVAAPSPFYNLTGDQTIAVLSGPGAGQIRYITGHTVGPDGTTTYTLDRPWYVVPDPSTSTVTIGNVPVNIAVYQNTLNGDGLRTSLSASAAGVSVPGSDVAVDDNDVSGVDKGLDVDAQDALDVTLFDVYADNSLHGNQFGVVAAANWAGDEFVPGAAVAADAAYLIGTVFRGDVVSATPGTAFYVSGYLGVTPSTVTTLMVLPVFDRCDAVGATYAFAFACPNPRDPNGGPRDPGIESATLVNCFASGPGTVGSAGVTRDGDPGNPTTDDAANAGLLAFAALGTDQFQGFANDYAGPQPAL